MQKYKEFLSKAAIFLPAVFIMYRNSRWAGLAVGMLNPARALDWLREISVRNRYTASGSNPFRDFSFEDYKETEEENQYITTGTGRINTNYNVQKEFFTSKESNIILRKDSCYVKNMTKLPRETVKNYMLSPVAFKAEKNSDRPQILIMHTHATESYLPPAGTPYDAGYAFRTTDKSQNMVAVGKVIADTLNSMGYNTLQDTTLHDYPSYNGSYDKSRDTVESYLEKYPSIKIVLDIHRDRVERSDTIISPVVNANGTEYAQIMIISGRDNGYMNMPNYPENLKFASRLQNQLTKDLPGLTRPVLFDYRNYNQQLTTGSLLVEFGTHGSTLEQAKNSRFVFAKSLAKTLDNMS